MANTNFKVKKADIDVHKTHLLLALRQTETEGFIAAAQDQSILLEIFRLIFFTMGQTLRVDSVTQARRLLTSSSQVIFFTMDQTLRVNSAIQATRLLTSSS